MGSMIVRVSTRKQTELDRVLAKVKKYYKQAQETNALHPGFIKKPGAWALYQAWRDVDAKGDDV